MSDQVARAHTSQSNRARAREAADRKVVFKSVVENPFRVQWPSISTSIQNALLACVVDMLNDITPQENGWTPGSYQRRGHLRCRASLNAESLGTQQANVTVQEEQAKEVEIPDPPAMEVEAIDTDSASWSSVVMGINQVTQRLERLARSYRYGVDPSSGGAQGPMPFESPSTSLSRIVIACRGDVDPPIIIGHLPALVAACNSMRNSTNAEPPAFGGTWLIPMPKGAEHVLAAATGLRRVSVLLIDSSSPKFSMLASLLDDVPLPSAPWLGRPMGSQVALVPTHIKQLRTTAPKDMKAAKEKRAAERAAAKERKRAKRRRMRVTVSGSGSGAVD